MAASRPPRRAPSPPVQQLPPFAPSAANLPPATHLQDCCAQNNFVFQYLESVLPGKVPWNFRKYLVGKDGVPVAHSDAITSPTKFESQIDKMLASA